MTTQHTPGPWAFQALAGHHDFAVYDQETGRDIALVRNFNEPNAALIAAAPELLAIAIRASETNGTLLGQAATWIGGIVDAYKMTGGNKESGERLYQLLHELDEASRAAIAKARGK